MYSNFVNDRKTLGFMCLRDIEAGNQVAMIFETLVIWIAITIFVNSRLFINEQDSTELSVQNQKYQLTHQVEVDLDSVETDLSLKLK